MVKRRGAVFGIHAITENKMRARCLILTVADESCVRNIDFCIISDLFRSLDPRSRRTILCQMACGWFETNTTEERLARVQCLFLMLVFNRVSQIFNNKTLPSMIVYDFCLLCVPKLRMERNASCVFFKCDGKVFDQHTTLMLQTHINF